MRWDAVDLTVGTRGSRRPGPTWSTAGQISEPKSGGSRRNLPPPDPVALEGPAGHSEERFTQGEPWTDSGLVLTDESGERVQSLCRLRAVQRSADRAGSPT